MRNFQALKSVAFGILRRVVVAISIVVLSWVWSPEALALVPVGLSDLSYRDCPPELSEGAVLSGSIQSANCFIVSGKATNKSGKPVVNADIFGRIYDANHNNVLPNRNRLGSIEEVPPGVSDFEFTIMVPVTQPLPLQLEQFKASGFKGRVRRS
ncbi:MAG: hypothetical protein J7641_19835 [Cyanobacteria bacterium SID2]|nr:hypothetical protein [Cyanobacteria bacterium SID2]MBP0004214.1 hypothetical protein [Cyanobacteria bacterium SBC]